MEKEIDIAAYGLALSALALTLVTGPAFAEDREGTGTNFASDGGLGTARIVKGCDRGEPGCTGFASDGGLGTR